MTRDKKRAVYAGSFDIFTNGHQDILHRALEIFDEVTILIAVSPSKKPLLTVDQRVEMLGRLYGDNQNVVIDTWSGLTIDYAKENKIQFLVRGLRPTGDFDIEYQMASINRELSNDVDTIFLITSGEHFFVSSSMTREILGHGGDISKYVPKEVFEYIKEIN